MYSILPIFFYIWYAKGIFCKEHVKVCLKKIPVNISFKLYCIPKMVIDKILVSVLRVYKFYFKIPYTAKIYAMFFKEVYEEDLEYFTHDSFQVLYIFKP